ncbi:MAG: beta-lactamase family protein, partial [Actinomycetia bacterium]|nr:beta-lactamase family protein [Actinomycetes bacterium]
MSRIARVCAAGASVLGLAAVPACGEAASPPLVASNPSTTRAIPTPPVAIVAPEGDFTAVARLFNDAIAAHLLPGAVVEIGHGGTVVLRQAFGSRRLASEPGLDGSPAPAEPMTVDTIFDLASLTKILVTTTAVLQLYEQGSVQIDDPVQTYLPEFNPANDPRRAKVTLRMLLTHTSGIGGDLSRQGP